MLLLLGAAPDTGNQGVSALNQSAVAGLNARGFSDIAVADHGRGVRQDGGVTRVGLTHNRRLWRGDCLRTVAASVRVGGVGSPSARAFLSAQAVLDVSGGDSFTDLYGPKRFLSMTLAKCVALRAGRPLILLPQTLGPFHDPTRRAVATHILRKSTATWVRDARSEHMLVELLGADFDPQKYRRGPDMAVLLPAHAPPRLPARVAQWLAPHRDGPVAGLNVSGLLCQRPDNARQQYGLTDAHPEQIEAIARTLLTCDPTLRLMLISHVVRPQGDAESDYDAALALSGRLSSDYADRVTVLPQHFDASELKWIISRLDWFAGARMHSTIAGFSSGVPTLGLGYSDKADGVFRECGFDGHVADLRRMDTASLADRARASYLNRVEMQALLRRTIAPLKARAEAQMDAIAAAIPAASHPRFVA